LALILTFMAAEVVIALSAKSLALLSDAAHMLTDAAAIALALFAARLAARPPRGGYTYGLKRAEILSAQVNGASLLLLGIWLGYEAVRRLVEPVAVTGFPVLVTAGIGVVVNVAAGWCLNSPSRDGSLNIRGAFAHITNDAYAFGATAVAGVVILITGFARADAIATLVVVTLMLFSGLGLLRDSGRILLEAAPAGVDPDEVGREIAAMAAVDEVHDLHIWVITSGQAALSAHLIVAEGADCHAIRQEVGRWLGTTHNITHSVLQVDHCSDVPDAVHCDDPHGPTHRVGSE
jgi:cobalt-zinc-cadmium efflux system protein